MGLFDEYQIPDALGGRPAALGTGQPPGYAPPGPQNAGPLQELSDWYNQGGGLASMMGMKPWTQQFAEDPTRAMTDAFGFAAPIRAFHGSPYAFDAFDLSKTGTGEGAQAYGHGMYFAENPNVAASYKLTQPAPGGSFAIPPEARDALKHMDYLGYDNASEALRAIRTTHDWKSNFDLRDIKPNDVNAVDSYLSANPRGHMYEVNLHADPAAMLDWDRPLTQQSPAIQAATDQLRQIGQRESGTMTRSSYPTGQELYQGLQSVPRPGFLSASDISGQLRQAGIPGIQYLDRGSRAAGAGSRNYVMFDPSKIEILRRYGFLGPLGAAGIGAESDAQP